MAKILIVGAGDLGGRVATGLADAGHAVHALRRRLLAPPGVTAVCADVTRPETLRMLPADLDAVVIALSPGEPGEAAYRATYLDGTRHVLAALRGRPPRVLVWVSSTSVYGESAGEWVDEDTPTRPTSATAQVLCDSEALVRASGLPATCVRLSGLYGPGRHRLLRWLASGRPVQAEPPAWTNRIHVEDAAALVTHLVMRGLAGEAIPAMVIGTDDCPVPQHEVLDWLAERTGLPALPRISGGAETGKRLRNRGLHGLGLALRYPDFRTGYENVLNSTGDAWR